MVSPYDQTERPAKSLEALLGRKPLPPALESDIRGWLAELRALPAPDAPAQLEAARRLIFAEEWKEYPRSDRQALVEYLAAAFLDMAYHKQTSTESVEPRGFENAAMTDIELIEEIIPRYRSGYFSHIFAGGYSAGYYSYIWADVLTSDAAEAFAEAPGGFYDRELAKKLVDNLFAVRNAVDPADAYRAFRGRDAEIDALMRDRGFPVP